MKSRILAILVLVVLLTACARPKPATPQVGTPTVPPEPTDVPAALAATSTSVPAIPTASPVPAVPTFTAVAPSATSVPAAAVPTATLLALAPTATTIPPAAPAAPSPPRPIVFPAGASSMTVQDQLPAGALHRYSLRILAGQTLSLELPGLLGWAALAVRGADGTVLLSERVGAISWRGVVPKTQDYLVDVQSVTNAATSYLLEVSIPPLQVPQATVIAFPAGGTSATVQGALVPGAVQHYVLRVLIGQTLTINAPGLQGKVALTVWGADGFVLLPESAMQAAWSGQVPKTQDYFVDVRSIAATQVSYTLQFSVPALPTPQPPRTRITFPAGGTGATLHGSLAAFSIDGYVLKIMAGQTLNVTVPGLPGKVLLVIWGADGTVLLTDHAIASTFSGQVPSTQDYFIDVRTSTAPVSYTLQVNVPPLPAPQPALRRITFQAGAISATEVGTLAANASARYVLKALAGQTLNAETATTLGQVILIIWGADGTVLLTDHAGSHSFGGPLPSTQDYYIDVRAVGSGPARYTLTVTIPPR